MMTDTYPNEIWPSDVSVEQLDGTTDQRTGLPYIAKGVGPTSTPTYEVQYNRRLQRKNAMLAHANQGRVVDEGGLWIGVYALDATIDGVAVHFAGATDQACTDEVTNYVYVDSTGALQVVTAATGWPSEVGTYVPLAEVTCSGGDITAMLDVRGRGGYAVGVSALDGRHLGDLGVNGGVSVLLTATLIGGNTVTVHDANAPFKYRVIDAWSIASSADGGTWSVDDGTSAVVDTVTVTGTANAVNRASAIVGSVSEIAADGTLRVVGDGVNADVVVYVLVVRVA